MLRGKHLSKLNEQKVVVKEDGKILKNKFEVKGKDLLRDLTNDRYDLEEIINRGDGSMFEYKELDSRGREYLLRFERLKLQIDKHEGTVIDRGKTGNNDVRLENKNSNMVLNLRNKDCVTFLTTRLCDDHELGLKKLMDQKGHKQRGMSIRKQVHLYQGLEELLEQSDNFSVKQHEKVWSRRSGCMNQIIAIQEVIQTGFSSTSADKGDNNFQDSLASVHGSGIKDEGRSDNLFARHQEKGWLRMLRCLDLEVTVQEIKQAGLSPIPMRILIISKPVRRGRCKL